MGVKSTLSRRAMSFVYAFKGVVTLVRTQRNAWIHAAATGSTVGLGVFFGLEQWEWCAVVLAIAAVWGAEALNTSIEFLADTVTVEYHPLIEKAKDVAAGAVLFSAIGAFVIGCLIFGPRLWAIL